MHYAINAILFPVILFLATGCGNGTSSVAKSDSSIITPLAENWPKTKDGIVVNWLGNMVINGNEYSPFNKFSTGFMKEGKTTVTIHLSKPPIGYEEIQIVPAIRLRRDEGSVMYEIKISPVTIGSKSAITCDIIFSDFPVLLKTSKNGDLICEIGYYYDGKYKVTCISNIPVL